jgi:DNA-binding NtrC family response regulator
VHVVLVHDESEFRDAFAAALRLAGYRVEAFFDPMDAWDIWDSTGNIAMLITRVRFPPGKPNGITLARMARFKRPGIRVLFAALPEFAEHANGLGTFMPTPVLIPDIVDIVGRLLKSDGQGTG